MALRPDAASVHQAFAAHARLWELFDEVQQELITRRATRLGDMLRELGRHLLLHFDHEEEGGYFTEAIERAPHLRERAEGLLKEHADLEAQLAALQKSVAEASDDGQGWAGLTDEFSAFLQRFRSHETAENTLLQQAYNLDVAAED